MRKSYQNFCKTLATFSLPSYKDRLHLTVIHSNNLRSLEGYEQNKYLRNDAFNKL